MFSALGPTISKTATACKRVSKTVGLFHAITEILNILSRTSKLFVRTRPDHRDIIHDEAHNFAFHQKSKSF